MTSRFRAYELTMLQAALASISITEKILILLPLR
jgi:hypothetical protein